MIYFQIQLTVCLFTVCNKTYSHLAGYCICYNFMQFKNFNLKLPNFNFKIFEKQKQKSKNVAYQRLNRIKTHEMPMPCASCTSPHINPQRKNLLLKAKFMTKLNKQLHHTKKKHFVKTLPMRRKLVLDLSPGRRRKQKIETS